MERMHGPTSYTHHFDHGKMAAIGLQTNVRSNSKSVPVSLQPNLLQRQKYESPPLAYSVSQYLQNMIHKSQSSLIQI